ncbi:MAG: PepSY domain-containing protein [Blastocatellia bacterium]
MKTRALHRIVGLVMLLPLVGWAVTGAFFFLKPGYGGAYEALQVRTYPIDANISLQPDPSWLEVRLEKTILGEHLLARTTGGWRHLDPRSLQPRPRPSGDDIRVLVNDAFSVNPSRYGQVTSIDDASITTDTGVHVALDWNRLALAQRGKDTDRIDTIYKIHYLQWTGVESVDRVVGALGILLLLLLSALGARLFFGKGSQ